MTSVAPRCHAVIVAAGSGSRLQTHLPKQYLNLLDAPVLWHSAALFARDARIHSTKIALAADDPYYAKTTISSLPNVRGVVGGDTRQASVLNALQALSAADQDWVFVHDGARPCFTSCGLDAIFAALKDEPVGMLLAAPVADTLKRADASGHVVETVAREPLWRALTPQVFRYGLLRHALEDAACAGIHLTDDSAAMERMGHAVKLVRGRDDNLKITQGQDLSIAEQIMRTQIAAGLRQV